MIAPVIVPPIRKGICRFIIDFRILSNGYSCSMSILNEGKTNPNELEKRFRD
jgi:hypothetical protein